MLLKTNKTVDETAYLENWPAHYYEIKDIDLREKLLKEKLVDNQESTDDKRRLEILERRYAGRISGGKRPDHFVGAWMNILIDGRPATTFFNKKRIEKSSSSTTQTLAFSMTSTTTFCSPSGRTSPSSGSKCAQMIAPTTPSSWAS